jgi:hypothetical protein
VDGDGVITSADVTMLRRYIAATDKAAFKDSNPSFDEAAADVNGDGTIDSEDVALLRRWIAECADNKPGLGLLYQCH